MRRYVSFSKPVLNGYCVNIIVLQQLAALPVRDPCFSLLVQIYQGHSKGADGQSQRQQTGLEDKPGFWVL